LLNLAGNILPYLTGMWLYWANYLFFKYIQKKKWHDTNDEQLSKRWSMACVNLIRQCLFCITAGGKCTAGAILPLVEHDLVKVVIWQLQNA